MQYSSMFSVDVEICVPDGWRIGPQVEKKIQPPHQNVDFSALGSGPITSMSTNAAYYWCYVTLVDWLGAFFKKPPLVLQR